MLGLMGRGVKTAFNRKSPWLDAQLLHFIVVVLAVENVPFLRAFRDDPSLALDLLPGGSVDPELRGKKLFQNLASFHADGIAVLDEVHKIELRQRVSDGVRQLVDLVPRGSHIKPPS